MKKLLNLKEWLTVPEAIRHLSILFGEDVGEADLLRLALDGHLTLSVYFVNGTTCVRGPLVSFEDAKRNTSLRDAKGLHPIEGITVDDGRVIECGSEVNFLKGVWDLSMIGSERAEIESRYQGLTNGPEVEPDWWASPILCREDGTYCQLMTRRGERHVPTEPYFSRTNYELASVIPSDTVLVLRTSALRDLETRMSEPQQITERPIELRERTTLLVIIASLAKMSKIDVSKPSAAAAAIGSQTVLMGAAVSPRTIENHLKRIPEALEGRSV
jgi:hypothetical protein